jgi:1,4-dihydroxy-2-naphthoate polyprenyltransferase
MKPISDPAQPLQVTDSVVMNDVVENVAYEQSPHGLAAAMVHALRLPGALALSVPAFYGAMVGAWVSGRFSAPALVFLIATVFAAALFYQALTAVYDYRKSLDPEARSTSDLPDTPFSLMANGVLPPSMLQSVGYLCLAIGLLCTLWLGLLVGWPVFFFGGLSFLLIAASFQPPVRYAFRGWGMGELGAGLAFGVLPLLGAFYSQAQSLSWLPLFAGLPLVLLSILVVLNENLGTWRRDWLIGKQTLPVTIGAPRALDMSVLLTMVAYVAILLIVVWGKMPLWQLGGLATLPLALGAFSEVRRSDVTAEDGYKLRNAAAKAAVWTAILLSASLLISRAG